MKPPFESDIRAQIRRVLNGAHPDAPVSRIHLPARDAHASVHLPQGADADALAALDFGTLYGAQLVDSVRMVNGWLLFTFSPAFLTLWWKRSIAFCPHRSQHRIRLRKTACMCSPGTTEPVVPIRTRFIAR
ncbi:MAG: hypothetical protein R2912_00880 [Eubacteriales bacterium]